MLRGEIDMTLDKDCKTDISDNNSAPLLKGAQVQRYAVREKPKQGELKWVNLERFLHKYGDSAKVDVAQNSRVSSKNSGI